mmetsp:Transcript_46077/g.148068  ORF Transcript_46077/g.148068 Transcript_46077/m.148068 type:complete len:81 (-) Transcript_46077:57-299(-)
MEVRLQRARRGQHHCRLHQVGRAPHDRIMPAQLRGTCLIGKLLNDAIHVPSRSSDAILQLKRGCPCGLACLKTSMKFRLC